MTSPPSPPYSLRPPSTRPACGAAATGRFCANCDSPLAEATCASCKAELSPGANFCHRCGTGVGATAATATRSERSTNPLPWVVAALAFLALFAMAAGRPAPPGMRGPDISNLSPQEHADRLYNRVMLLASEGKVDEYTRHQQDIASALSQARSNGAAR